MLINNNFNQQVVSFAVSILAQARLSKLTLLERIRNSFDNIKLLFKDSVIKSFCVPINRLNTVRIILMFIILTSSIFWCGTYLASYEKFEVEAQLVQGPSKEYVQVNRLKNLESNFRDIDEISLEEKYRILGGKYYINKISQYLPAIDKMLREKNLDNDPIFIQGMFYVGWQESHWTPSRVSSNNIKGGYPTGIFQFLPGTFMSVSNGDIFNVEDQVRAFITMWERGRCDEFAVVFICGYPPCLEIDTRNYLLHK